MLKIILSSFIIVVFFNACFSSNPTKFQEQSEIKEANNCSKFNKIDQKLECYSKIVDKNSVAQLRLGIYNVERKELEKALVLLQKAKGNGNFYANVPLAYLYFKGTGVEKDLDKAFNYLKETSHIDPNSAYQLSRFYFQGIIVEKDIEEGLSLMLNAANKGMKVAQNKLAFIYKKGSFGVTKNEEKAIRWLNKSKNNTTDKTFNIYKL